MWSLSVSVFLPSAYKWVYVELKGNIALQYLAWITYPMVLITFASLFCHLVAPQAIGEFGSCCGELMSTSLLQPAYRVYSMQRVLRLSPASCALLLYPATLAVLV